MIEKEILDDIYYFMSSNEYTYTLLLGFLVGILTGIFFMYLIYIVINQNKKRNEYADSLTDEQYKIADKMRRIE